MIVGIERDRAASSAIAEKRERKARMSDFDDIPDSRFKLPSPRFKITLFSIVGIERERYAEEG